MSVWFVEIERLFEVHREELEAVILSDRLEHVQVVCDDAWANMHPASPMILRFEGGRQLEVWGHDATCLGVSFDRIDPGIAPEDSPHLPLYSSVQWERVYWRAGVSVPDEALLGRALQSICFGLREDGSGTIQILALDFDGTWLHLLCGGHGIDWVVDTTLQEERCARWVSWAP